MKLVALAVLAALEIAARADVPTAENLYDEGQTAYARADYATAIAKWQASYDLSGKSGLLFNLAQAQRLSGDCPRALVAYQKFVEADPDLTSEQHKLAEDFMHELEVTCQTVARTIAEPPIEVPKTRPTRGRELKIAGLVTSGAGATSIVIGLVLGHHAATLGDAVTNACSTSCDWSAQKSNDAAGRRDATIGYALDTIGAAAIAGGAIMYYLGDRERAFTISPRPREGGAVVSWSGSW
jgi:tetratricopeptide (TPR) repeat protein